MRLVKQLLLFIFLPLSSLIAQSGYTIKMELTGFKDGTAFKLINLFLDRVVDSTQIQNGILQFKGSANEPFTGRIHTVDNKYLIVYFENKNIEIKGNYADFYYSSIGGSEVNTYWIKSRDAQREQQVLRDSLIQKYFTLSNADSLKAKQITSRLQHIDSTRLQYRISFIKTEKPTYFTIQELFFIRNDLSPDSLTAMYSKFPKSLRGTKEAAVIRSYINNKSPEVGNYFTNIKGLDQDGKKHQLSDFKGKYVLLEFWASWCGPCRQENPITLKVYNKYQSKGFEIFGFSTDADKKSWAEAVKKDNLRWINVSDLKGLYSSVAASYRVRAIPQNFLIDQRGFIIAKNLRGNALEEKLKDIFNE